MPDIDVDGLKLVYEELGSGPPIVWLQGGRSGRDLMRPIAGALSAPQPLHHLRPSQLR